jgi:hypothetical protein
LLSLLREHVTSCAAFLIGRHPAPGIAIRDWPKAVFDTLSVVFSMLSQCDLVVSSTACHKNKGGQ